MECHGCEPWWPMSIYLVYHRFFGHALSYPIFHNVPHQYTPHLHSSHSMTPWDPNGICLRIFLQLDWLFEALHQWCNLGKVLGHVITFSTFKPCKATWSNSLYDNILNIAYHFLCPAVLCCKVQDFKITLEQPGDLLYQKSFWPSGPNLLKANANHGARRPWWGKWKLAPPQKNMQVCRTMMMMEKGDKPMQASAHHQSCKYILAEKRHGWHYHPAKPLT